MEISFTEKDLEFRDEIRSWIENEYPKHIKEKQEKGESLTKEEVTEFHKRAEKFVPFALWALMLLFVGFALLIKYLKQIFI